MKTTHTNKNESAALRLGARFRAKAVCALGAASLVWLAGCTPMHTTQGGAVGINRTQYMSSLVSEQELQAEAASQYSQLIQQARAQKALNPSSAQTQRVRNISQRLIKQVGVFRPDAAGWNWEVNVLQSKEVNAWCMPGGKIAVYSGLIEQLKATDDELAAVIGHEIAHALREHARERVSRQMAAGVGLGILAAVTGSQATTDLGGKLSEVMFTLPNSRTHETEADLMGVELAARAGYDPRAAVTLWRKMSALGGGGQPEFLSTHPSASTRIAELERISEQMMPLYRQAGGKR